MWRVPLAVNVSELPGVARRLVTCLASPRQVTKRRRSPVYRPCGVPSNFHKQAGLRNSHDLLRSHVLRQSSPKSTACLWKFEAVHRGVVSQNPKQKQKCSVRAAHTKSTKNMWATAHTPPSFMKPLLILIFGPHHPPPSSGGWSGVVGDNTARSDLLRWRLTFRLCRSHDCLSTQCEFRSRLTSRAHAGNLAEVVDWGRLFWVTFFGKTKKVTSRRATPGKQERYGKRSE